jgi:uncharacterized protein (TIGR03643 family)
VSEGTESTSKCVIIMRRTPSETLSAADVNRIIQMAWEDRTSFDAIEEQFGLTPGNVIHLMRRSLSDASFKLWRERTAGRKTKHVAKRGFEVGRFRSQNQKGS